jgi:hypothetical protein
MGRRYVTGIADTSPRRRTTVRSVLIRPHDADDESRRRRFLADQGLGHFVVNGKGHATPVVVPTQFTLTNGPGDARAAAQIPGI